MAFLSGIFGGKPDTPAPAPAANQPSPAQPAKPAAAAEGSGGPITQQAAVPNQQVNPLDGFMQMLTPTKEVIEAQQAQQQALSAPVFPGMNADALKATVGKTNFAANIPQDKLTAAMSGSDPAAFLEVLNLTAQNAAQAAMAVSHQMVETSQKTAMDRFGATFDSRLRDAQVRTHNPVNPALQHPLAKSMVESYTRQIASANPNLSADQAAKRAEEMMISFADHLTGSKQQQEAANNPTPKGEKDWLQWFGDELPADRQ